MKEDRIKHLIYLLIFVGLLLSSILVCRYFDEKDNTLCKNLGYDGTNGDYCIKKIQTEPGLFRIIWSNGRFETPITQLAIYSVFQTLGIISFFGIFFNLIGTLGWEVKTRD